MVTYYVVKTIVLPDRKRHKVGEQVHYRDGYYFFETLCGIEYMKQPVLCPDDREHLVALPTCPFHPPWMACSTCYPS